MKITVSRRYGDISTESHTGVLRQRAVSGIACTCSCRLSESLEVRGGRVRVDPADPAAFQRVTEVLGRRGAGAAGLAVVPG